MRKGYSQRIGRIEQIHVDHFSPIICANPPLVTKTSRIRWEIQLSIYQIGFPGVLFLDFVTALVHNGFEGRRFECFECFDLLSGVKAAAINAEFFDFIIHHAFTGLQKSGGLRLIAPRGLQCGDGPVRAR